MALTRIASIVGTPCGNDHTRSERWLLAAPSVGTADVSVTLVKPALSLHSAAMVFVGVDQTTPVRASTAASNVGVMSVVGVPSATGDLVVSTVGRETRSSTRQSMQRAVSSTT